MHKIRTMVHLHRQVVYSNSGNVNAQPYVLYNDKEKRCYRLLWTV